LFSPIGLLTGAAVLDCRTDEFDHGDDLPAAARLTDFNETLRQWFGLVVDDEMLVPGIRFCRHGGSRCGRSPAVMRVFRDSDIRIVSAAGRGS
jgi:hypothetical protein